MIYEERYTIVTLGRVAEYLAVYREKIAPYLKNGGCEPLLLLSGLIGDRGNALLQISRAADYAAWNNTQEIFRLRPGGLVENEEVRLLRSIASRPKQIIPPEDKRPVLGYRKLFVNPNDLPKFVEYSEKGVWPLYEAADCPVFGLFSPVWETDPTEIILMGSYRGPGHWEETRFLRGKPADVDPQIWEQGREMGRKRGALSVRGSFVRLWQSHDIL